MKKISLLVAICLASLYSMAQCVPDPIYAGESFGFWPTDGLAAGVTNVAYDEVIDIKIPVNGGDIDPSYSAYDIDSIAISGIIGLPVGYDYSCHVPTCVIPGGDQGCVSITGITDSQGDYPLNISLVIYVNINGVVLALPYNDTSYTLEVNMSIGIDELSKEYINLGQNIPNPTSDITLIPYALKKDGMVSFVIYNVVGESVFEDNFRANTGQSNYEFNANELSDGVYLYSISIDGFSQTKRMLVRR